MTETREQVFVSSTYLDLKKERRAVIETLLMADCFPAGMELFPASTEERWELIQRVIDQSDYYVVIVGGRYGTTDDEGMSYTEREYDYADSIGLPILGFLHGDPGEISASKTEMEPNSRLKLNDFRAKVQQRMCRYFASADDLAGKVSLSIMAARKQYPAMGWVRGSEALTDELREELLTLRAKTTELELHAKNFVSGSIPTSDLRSGSDKVVLAYVAFLERGQGILKTTSRTTGTITVTWNNVIKRAGPLLLEEDTEERIFAAIRRMLRDRWASSGDDDDVRPGDVTDAEGHQFERLARFELDPQTQNLILVQLRALGFIEPGRKKRGIADAAKYWRLTPAGEAAVLSLLVERREGEGADVPGAIDAKSTED